jgi:tRNA-(ms[2]io[6]A)-hydroxylase
MYGLKLPTDPRWADLASISIEDLLTDHAYCEQKAASNGISIIQNFPELDELVDEIMPLVTEEWGHFKMVVEHLKKRNLKLGKKRKDVYVNELRKFTIKGGSRETLLLETLLTSALIEARSCERFKVLSQNLQDAELRSFYKNLMVSEAGHYKMFLDLAIRYIGKEKTMQRWEEFLIAEAEIMKQMELRGDRIH